MCAMSVAWKSHRLITSRSDERSRMSQLLSADVTLVGYTSLYELLCFPCCKGGGTWGSAVIRLCVCLPDIAWCIVGLRNTNRKPRLEIEATGQRGRTATTGSGRNGDEVVAGAAPEAFARWLHRRCPGRNAISRACYTAALYLVCFKPSPPHHR